MSEDWYVASIDRVTGAADAMHQALDRVTDALQEARSRRLAAVRALVDDEGRSFTEIGDLTGVSRQMIARLYRRGSPDVT